MVTNLERRNQLAELPTDVKRKLFSLLAPRDAAQFFLVCKSLQEAVQHDTVWEAFARSRWRCPHEPVFTSWKSLYVSGNGWDTCALQPACVDPFPKGPAMDQRHFHWKFQSEAAGSKGAILKWAFDSCECLTSPQPDKASSWISKGHINCDRAISGCCMRGGISEQVVVGDVYGNLSVQMPQQAHPPVTAGRKRPRGELAGQQQGSTDMANFKVSSTEELRAPRDLHMADSGKLWLLADAEAGFSGRVAVVDLEAQTSSSCRDFMDGFVYHGLCAHPGNPQVAVVIGAHRGSVCPSCTHEEISEPMYAPLWSSAALCGHRNRAAVICITDMRAPQVVDRCNLPSVSVVPQIVACPGRDHYVFTSHHDCAVCAWDVRNLVYPVHEGRLDHRADPRPHFDMTGALWRSPNQAMCLTCSFDTMLGQAGNGMLWHFDLSAMLGWAAPACPAPSQRGCWVTHRGSSEAAPGSWAHPTPVGMIPGNMQSCKGVYVLPESRCGAFLAAGWNGCRVRNAEVSTASEWCDELDLYGPDLVSGLIHGAEPMGTYQVDGAGVVVGGGRACHPSTAAESEAHGGCGGAEGSVGGGADAPADEEVVSQWSGVRGSRGVRGSGGVGGGDDGGAWKPGDSLWSKCGKLSVVDWKMPFGINVYKLQPCEK